MSEIGHSTLLKFLVNTSKMAEKSEKTESTIKSKVPGKQTLRGDYIPELQNENQANDIALQDFSVSPVITVTKEESTFTKGDLKLQKVIVSEDISPAISSASSSSHDDTNKLSVTQTAGPTEVQSGIHSEVSSVVINTEGDTQTSTGDQKVVYKVTKIPKLKFKQAVDKIKQGDEIKETRDETTFGSKDTEAIPRLKDEKKLLQDSNLSEPTKTNSPKVDEEFDKIYDEIFENGPPSGNFPSPGKIEDPDKVETKFEEIIHSYDEQKVQIPTSEKIKSKIPLFKRKSEHDIYEPKENIRKNSLKQRNSIDEGISRLPVAIIREKQNVQSESNTNRPQTSENQPDKNKSNTTPLFKSDNTNISKTMIDQKNIEKIIPQNTDSKTITEVSKSKIPHLKKNGADEKASDIRGLAVSTQFSTEKRNEDKPEKGITENTTKTLNVKDNISHIKTEPLIITDNVENVPNTIYNNKKDITLHISENHIDNRKQTPGTNLKPETAQNERLLLDATNSNNDVIKTNKHFENKSSKTEGQSSHNKEINSFVPINQEFKETVKNPLQKSNYQPQKNQVDQQDKISDNITRNIPKDILHVSDNNVYLHNNPLKNNSIKEIKYDDSKNILNYENIKTNDNINIERESIKHITEDNFKMQDEITEDVLKDYNQIICDISSQQYINNKHVYESAQKSLEPTFETSRETIITESNEKMKNSINANNNQDKIILITKQQSEVKVEQEEITKEIAKNVTSQEESGKSDNISNKITTEVNNNEIKKEVEEDNKPITVITSNNNNLLENNEEDIIILKGKVNRIISRLDSKEFKINKCELDDVPREVSVFSKIALFEQNKSLDTTQKASIKNNKTDEIDLDKPKIVNGILKVDNGSLPSDSKFTYNTFLTYKKSAKNNFGVNENKSQPSSQIKPLTNFDKIYNTNINLNNFNKTSHNNVEENVFFQKEDVNKNIINEYKINKEIDLDMRRAKSLAELNFDGVQGRVRQMVVRMNSIDKMALERREQNEVRKKTDRKRHGSVSERIALFEQDANEKTVHLMKKITPIRMESVLTTTTTPKPEELCPALNEEDYAKRILELTQARTTYDRYDNMTYIELSDGGRMPSLTVGTALLDSQLVKPIIKAAIDLGYRSFDTAYIYGNEQAVGEAINEKIQDGTVRREELFVISKLWSTNHRRDLVPKACRQSLDAMGLDFFDLYLIHNPMSFKEGPNPVPKIANVLQYSEHDYLEAWFGIEGLIKEGLVKRGGVSNFNSVQVERVLEKGKIKPVVNQVECHPYLSQARLQDYLSSRGIAMSCFGCLGSSGTPPEFRSSLPPVINDPLVRTMAAGLGVSPAQLLISYEVSLGRGVVVKASSAAHLWDDLRALDIHLAPVHAAALAALNRNKRTFTFEGMGDTHKNYPFKIPF